MEISPRETVFTRRPPGPEACCKFVPSGFHFFATRADTPGIFAKEGGCTKRSCPHEFPSSPTNHHPSRPRFQYQTDFDYLPTMAVEIENIGEVQAPVDTGARRTALHARNDVQRDLVVWNRSPLRGLGGEAYLIGAVDFDLKMEMGINRRQHVPAFGDFPADLMLWDGFPLPQRVLNIYRGWFPDPVSR